MKNEDKKKFLLELADNPELMELARRAIEDCLVDLRDSRISMLRRNGLVICEKNGQQSSLIRMGTESALAIGLKAIAETL